MESQAAIEKIKKMNAGFPIKVLKTEKIMGWVDRIR